GPDGEYGEDEEQHQGVYNPRPPAGRGGVIPIAVRLVPYLLDTLATREHAGLKAHSHQGREHPDSVDPSDAAARGDDARPDEGKPSLAPQRPGEDGILGAIESLVEAADPVAGRPGGEHEGSPREIREACPPVEPPEGDPGVEGG